jgi:hypothetical protein
MYSNIPHINIMLSRTKKCAAGLASQGIRERPDSQILVHPQFPTSLVGFNNLLFPTSLVGFNNLLFPTSLVGFNNLLFPTSLVGFNNLLFPTSLVGFNILLFPFGLWSFGLWNLTKTKFSQIRPNFPQNDQIL